MSDAKPWDKYLKSCWCGGAGTYTIINVGTGEKRVTCGEEDCDWAAHCRLLKIPFQARAILNRRPGDNGIFPP